MLLMLMSLPMAWALTITAPAVNLPLSVIYYQQIFENQQVMLLLPAPGTLQYGFGACSPLQQPLAGPWLGGYPVATSLAAASWMQQ